MSFVLTPRVIVTRPDVEAQRWVQALAQRSIDACALPLIVIVPATDTAPIRAAWARVGTYAALMFVSTPAVEHFFSLRPTPAPAAGDPGGGWPRLWVPGPGTGAALVRQGVDAARVDMPARDSAQFDSEALWSVVGSTVRPGDRVLVVRGGDGRPGQPAEAARAGGAAGFGRDWLAQRLGQAGAQVDFLLTYWRAVPQWRAEQALCARAAAADGSVWLFTSAQAVANLAACLPHQDWARARALVTHPRIAGAARAAGFGVVAQSRPGVTEVAASIESMA